jgi:hypothetical protein
MFGLAHMDMTPLFYGFVMFVGLWSMYYKLSRGKYFAFSVEVFVFWLVFSLHGGTMSGGFAAMVCALLAGTLFPLTRRKR